MPDTGTQFCSHMIRVAVTGVLMLLSSSATPAPIPQPFTAEYTIKRGILTIARMTREFTVAADGNYRFLSDTKATGVAGLFGSEQIVEWSEGRIEDDGLVPKHYHYRRSRGKKERRADIKFDEGNATIAGSGGSGEWQVEFEPGIMDKLAYQLALMRDLESGPGDLEYRVVESGKTKVYLLRYLGVAAIDTPSGAHDTLRFERRKPGSGRVTRLWCAPALGNLPVRVDYEGKDGAVTTVVLKAVSPRRTSQ